MRTIALFLLLCCLTVTTAEAGRKRKAPKRASPPTLVEMIDRAKKKLEAHAVGTSKIGGDYAVLAVWKQGTSKLDFVKVWKGRSVTKGYAVTLLKRNGVNSEYRVDKPEGFVVLALKTNVRARMGRGKKRAVAAVYAPYGEHLDDAALIKSGRRYLITLVDRAAKKLDALDVDSKVDASKRVTETVSSKILVTLLVIEHISPDDFDDRGVKATANRVFSLVGANREDAYDYAVSDAKAGGIAQFISETYAYTRSRYGEAKLKEGFVAGMRDHCNAAMAQYCLADWSIKQLSDQAYARLAKNEEDLGAYIAAAYNGGEKRAAKAYADDVDHWEESGHGLAGGTVIYVREFRAVYRYLWGP